MVLDRLNFTLGFKMNERIKELAEEAGCSIDSMGFGEGNIGGLVKLVVIECFKAAMIEAKGHMNPTDLMARMKQRTGVQE